jgi:tetratricopeptide (TPR) repeat protein
MDYSKICFIIMPFGTKDVDGKEVSFDSIYEEIFVPAIRAATLPEGGRLEARRTDQDFFSSAISQDMFSYLEYSRVALADITGLNANVFYEIGVRHRARESGTVIVRRTDAPIPFDIRDIKAFPYNYEPETLRAESRALITRVLEASLRANRIDSPVQVTLRAQRNDPPAFQRLLFDAENAIRAHNSDAAIAKFARAVLMVPGNALVKVRLGLLLKEQGEWEEVLQHFTAATLALPDYADAWRERGIAENKIYWKEPRPQGAVSGEASLRRALELSPDDYDAHASLGGVLKREGRLQESLEEYAKATAVSGGHSYPLLNEIKLRAHLARKLELDAEVRKMLDRVEPLLRAQVDGAGGPFNPPWSIFDLSEVRFYQGDDGEFLTLLTRALKICTARWQPSTHRKSLELLLDVEAPAPVLRTAIQALAMREVELPSDS